VRRESMLVVSAVAVPVLYFGVMLVAAATWPGYSHVTQYVSELGGPDAKYPAIFNVGIVAMGVVCTFSAWGVFVAARRVGGRRVMSALAAVCIALFGVAMVMGGLFPMPNPLHGGFGLAFAMVPAPLFLALAVTGREGLGGLTALLVASFVFVLATMVVMMGVGHLVTRANVGLWQRLNALAMFPWLGIAGLALARRIERGTPA
jgi:hypothetical membrane protein